MCGFFFFFLNLEDREKETREKLWKGKEREGGSLQDEKLK